MEIGNKCQFGSINGRKNGFWMSVERKIVAAPQLRQYNQIGLMRSS